MPDRQQLPSSSYSHAVSRSSELMSCAKTALKIAKNRHEPWADTISPQQLQLCDDASHNNNNAANDDNDAFLLLRSMRVTLSRLETLVKRRGHTNDPTSEIETAVADMEHDSAALAVQLQTAAMGRNAQHRHHRKVVQQWFQGSNGELQAQLQKVMKHRAEVLAEQTKRRKKFMTVSSAQSNRAKPSFPKPPPPPPRPTRIPPPTAAANGSSNGTTAQSTGVSPPSPTTPSLQPPSTATTNSQLPPPRPAVPPPQPAPYDATLYTSTSGYGGGMRQRRAPQQQHMQMDRQTAQRVQEAEHAEQSLAELGTVFGKMSTIIAAQDQALGRIEDDVEAANTFVHAAQDEIGILYAIRKGNRPLILKTFGLLIFLIVFLRLYAK